MPKMCLTEDFYWALKKYNQVDTALLRQSHELESVHLVSQVIWRHGKPIGIKCGYKWQQFSS